MKPIRLSPSATLTPTPEGIIVRSDLGVFQITGADTERFLGSLAPLLDGSRDRQGIQVALDGRSPASVAAFLDLLAARGIVEEVPDPDQDERRRGQLAFLRRWPEAPAGAMERIAQARVVVAGAGRWGEIAAAELEAAGVGAVEGLGAGAIEGEAVLLLACVPVEEPVAAEQIAALAHRAGARTLWSHLDGHRAVLGPLTVPGRTACRACAFAEGINLPLGASPAPGPRAEIAARILGHLVALEALKILSAYAPSAMGGRVLIQDLATFESRLHTPARLPWCRICGQGVTPPGGSPRSRSASSAAGRSTR